MKVNFLETHDRLNHFKKDQSPTIFQGAQECLKENPNSLSMQEHFPYIYIYGHSRTEDSGSTLRIIWQPRLIKPDPSPNSFLFRAPSHTDLLEIIWILPKKEYWSLYKRDKMLADNLILWSIEMYKNKIEVLKKPHDDDWTLERIKSTLNKIAENQQS